MVVGQEVLVIRFFFDVLALFFRGVPHLRSFKNPVMIPFCLAGDCCIAFQGTSRGFAVSNPRGALFFVIISFASKCVSVYAVLLAALLEVPGNVF